MQNEQNVDLADPWIRAPQTFPVLSPEMATRVAAYGLEESFAVETKLFERGERDADFFLVLEGAITIFADDVWKGETPIFTYAPGQFTGELNLFNSRKLLVGARVAAGGRVLRVKHTDFRHLMSGEPDIGEIVMRAYILRRVGFILHGQAGVVVAGHPQNSDMIRLRQFLTRNGYPHEILDVEQESEEALLHGLDIGPNDLPVVVAPNHEFLSNPSNSALAERLGLTETLDAHRVYDVAVVGAGPAGLAAAVYAASEGLDTLVIEALAPGGQAGTSSKIENYLGFPTGISGQALAGRAQIQAQKFGAHLAIARSVTGLECSGPPFRLTLDDSQTVQARVVVVATGAHYRKLDVEDYAKYEGQGIQYAATAIEAQLCENLEVVVVGGGNSAGQAAIFLSRTAAHVHILVRGASLAATMSDYLVQRILTSPRITLHPYTEITALHGDAHLRGVTWTNRETGATVSKDVGSLFVMIGAVPNTDWLQGCLDLDPQGFIRTGVDCDGHALASPYATTQPGVFAVGDVRSGSVKRVASGVGEGSVVVHAIHGFLNPMV